MAPGIIYVRSWPEDLTSGKCRIYTSNSTLSGTPPNESQYCFAGLKKHGQNQKISPKVKQTVLVLFLLPLVLWLAPAQSPGGKTAETLRLESSVDAMGSTYSIAVYGEDRVRMEAAVEAAFEEARRLDRLLSNYRPSSELSAVNRLAG